MLICRFPPGAARKWRRCISPELRRKRSGGGPIVDLILVRLLFVIVVSVTCYVIAPFGRSQPVDAGIGALVGAAIVRFKCKLAAVSLRRLIGAAIGSILGICGAYLFALVIRS